MNLRADLYHSLAEAFADPPEWLTLAGSEWHLYEIASDTECLKDTQCLKKIANIPAESFAARRTRCNSLFVARVVRAFGCTVGVSQSSVCPETFAVAKIYRAAGLRSLALNCQIIFLTSWLS